MLSEPLSKSLLTQSTLKDKSNFCVILAKKLIKFNYAQRSMLQKVKSRYKVFPSAYASGAIAKCRKVGAKNWGKRKAEKQRLGQPAGKPRRVKSVKK
jgi:hypothetical protein